MSLRFHEISESRHRILNPFTKEKLMLVGKIYNLKLGMTQLDLCCGKGEMLCQGSDTTELHKWHTNNQKSYVQYTRCYFGWGVFVLRLAD